MESTDKSEQKKKSVFKFESKWDYLFAFMIIIALIFLFPTISDSISTRNSLYKADPSYPIPSIMDLLPCLGLVVIMVPLRFFLQGIFIELFKKIMTKKLREPKNDKDRKLAQVYPGRLAAHLYKVIYYTLATILGYVVLKDEDYFPIYFGGKGSVFNTYKDGFPKSFLYNKPKLFNFYYIFCFAYCLSDVIWLIKSSGSNEYLNMVAHHVCTIILILFSYLTNYVKTGALVLFIHNQTDIFVSAVRISIQTDIPEPIKWAIGATLIVDMVFARLFSFACVISTLFMIHNYGTLVTYVFATLLSFLYLMHINWTMKLFGKLFDVVSGKKLTDTVNYNKVLGKNATENKEEKEGKKTN